jgi:hypothetical protein
MNKRIQELAEQARQYANSMYPSGLDIPKWGPAYHEKFAELIVAECAKLLPPEMTHGPDGRPLEQVFKQHFGVEQ